MVEIQKIGLQINYETKRRISKNGIVFCKLFPLICSLTETLLLQLIHLQIAMNLFFVGIGMYKKKGVGRGGIGNKK
jgi:hypothetical protein